MPSDFLNSWPLQMRSKKSKARLASEYQELLTVARDLNTALTQHELQTKSKAIVIDRDMATYILDYFNSVHDTGVFSGTADFMPSRLLQAMEDKGHSLHSPLGDLWSLFWTALWVTLYNRHHPGETGKETSAVAKYVAGDCLKNVL